MEHEVATGPNMSIMQQFSENNFFKRVHTLCSGILIWHTFTAWSGLACQGIFSCLLQYFKMYIKQYFLRRQSERESYLLPQEKIQGFVHLYSSFYAQM